MKFGNTDVKCMASIVNVQDSNVLELEIFDEISDNWWDGVSPTWVGWQMKNNPDIDIVLKINSVGGSVSAGTTIYNMLKDSGRNIITKVYGLSASIASVIMLAAPLENRYIYPGAEVMIHEPLFEYGGGNSTLLRKKAEILDELSESIADIYALETSLTKEDALEKMKASTWFRTPKAIEWGFIGGSLEQSDEISNSIAYDWSKKDFTSSFKNVPASAKFIFAGENSSNPPKNNVDYNSDNNPKEEEYMNLTEFRAKNKAGDEEIKNLIATAKEAGKAESGKVVKSEEKERISAILNLGRVQMSAEMSEAIKNGLTADQFAVALVKAQNSAMDLQVPKNTIPPLNHLKPDEIAKVVGQTNDDAEDAAANANLEKNWGAQ